MFLHLSKDGLVCVTDFSNTGARTPTLVERTSLFTCKMVNAVCMIWFILEPWYSFDG